MRYLCTILFIILGFHHQLWSHTSTYFQQDVHTKIAVTLDDVHHFLRGNIELSYTNKSNDTLSFIYFHLYPNAYASNTTAYAKQMLNNGKAEFWKTKQEDRGFIDSLKFLVNKQSASIQATEHIDVIKLILPQKLQPGGTVEISTPFRVKIPYMTSRLGHVGQSYQITQWFPKPAVYDNNGWHAFPYLNYGEFYSEFGSYDVTITLPANYLVMATGNLVTQKEQQWMDSLACVDVDMFPNKKDNTPSSTQLKTIRFKENNIHDFAWFADKNWALRSETFVLPNTTDTITAYSAFYKDNSKGFGNSVNYLKEAILGYSKYVGNYPYKTVKSVAGPLAAGGGMEYPTITIIDDFKEPNVVRDVIIHEVGHNWFYGILGSNERRYPFMDESINSFFEKKVSRGGVVDTSSIRILRKNSIDTLKQNTPLNVALENSVLYALSKSNALTPMCMHSAEFKEMNYGLDIYQKGERYFNWLCAYMGEDNFIAAMHTYFNTWKYKHPQPEDLKAILQQHTDKSIDWFFDDAITMPTIPDFKLRKGKDGTFKVSNLTKNTLPVGVTLNTHQNNQHTIWTPPFTGTYHLKHSDILEDISNAFISVDVPDEALNNNFLSKTFKIKPFTSFIPSQHYNLYIMPALGYNKYDKFMLGAAIHNIGIPSKTLEYAFVPMYAFGSDEFVYTGYVSYIWRTNNALIKDVVFEGNSKRFSEFQSNTLADFQKQYWKNKIGATITFTPQSYSSRLVQKLNIAVYSITHQQHRNIIENGSLIDYEKLGNIHRQYLKLIFTVAQESKFYPYALNLGAILNKDFGMLSLDAHYKINYTASKKGIDFRFFAGKLIGKENNIPSYAHLNITGSGWTDYLYDNTFVGRSERSGFWSNQSINNYGGFYSHTQMMGVPIGRTSKYLLAMNVNVNVPNTPFSLFGNIAYAHIDQVLIDGLGIDRWQYEAGIAMHVLDRFTVALPILLSSDLNDNRKYNLGKNKVLKSIAFRMDLKDILPSKNILKYVL